MTARCGDPGGAEAVKAYLGTVGLAGLEVTDRKDFSMIELWDDRCIQVRFNTGEPIVEPEADRHIRG